MKAVNCVDNVIYNTDGTVSVLRTLNTLPTLSLIHRFVKSAINELEECEVPSDEQTQLGHKRLLIDLYNAEYVIGRIKRINSGK